MVSPNEGTPLSQATPYLRWSRQPPPTRGSQVRSPTSPFLVIWFCERGLSVFLALKTPKYTLKSKSLDINAKQLPLRRTPERPPQDPFPPERTAPHLRPFPQKVQEKPHKSLGRRDTPRTTMPHKVHKAPRTSARTPTREHDHRDPTKHREGLKQRARAALTKTRLDVAMRCVCMTCSEILHLIICPS